MSRKVTLEVFKFEELSETAQTLAIQKYRESNHIFMEPFNEGAIEKIKEAGFTEPKLQYSLSYCQGDGLSFSAEKYTKLEDLFNEVLGEGKKKTAKVLAENCTTVMSGNTNRYCYASRSDIDVYLENYTSSYNKSDRMDEVVNKVMTKLEDLYLKLCKQLENDGYADIEYQDSDESIKETLIANEYEYNEDGTRY